MSPLFNGDDRGLRAGGENKHLHVFNNHLEVFRNNYASGFVHDNYFENFPLIIAVVSLFLFILKKRYFTTDEKTFLAIPLTIAAIVILLTVFYPYR